MTSSFDRASRVLATLALLAPAAAGAQETNVALVHRLLLDGQAAVQRGNQTQAAEMGQRLNNGDVVTTSPNTRAAIRFTDDGSLIRLNPGSVLNVRTEGDREALTKTLELEFGELWARVTEQRGTFQVQTPSGVAAVKGIGNVCTWHHEWTNRPADSALDISGYDPVTKKLSTARLTDSGLLEAPIAIQVQGNTVRGSMQMTENGKPAVFNNEIVVKSRDERAQRMWVEVDGKLAREFIITHRRVK